MDGYVRIGTEVDDKGFETGVGSLSSKLDKSMNSMTSSMNKTFGLLKANIILQVIKPIAQAIVNELGDAITRLDTMANYENVMGNLGIGAEESQASIKRLSEALKGLPTTLDSAALSVQRLTSANNNVKASTEMFLAMNNAILAGGASAGLQATAIEQLSQAYTKGKPDMMEWRTLMMAMPAQLAQVANVMGYINADALGEALRKGEVSMNEFMVTLVKMNREGLNGFKSFDEQARNATGGIATSFQNMKTAIARALADIMNEIGRSNIASFFDGIRNAIDRVVPYIAAFIRLIKTAIVYVLGLFGVKMPKSTKKASDGVASLGGAASSTAKDLGKTTGSAKALNKELKQLASFDEMNVLKDNTSSSGGSGGGGGSDIGAGGLGDIDLSAFDDLEDKTSKVDEIFEKMVKSIKKFADTLNGLGFDGIMRHIESIGESLRGIFTSPSVINASQKWVDTVMHSFDTIGGNIIQIGINIADWFLGSIDTYLKQNSGRITDFIVSIFDLSGADFDLVAQLSDVFASISEIFTGSSAEQIGADIIAMFANPFMSATELMLKFVSDMMTLFIQPIIDNAGALKTAVENTVNAIKPYFDTLAEAVTYIGDTWSRVYDEHLHPFFENLTIGISDTFGKFLEVYNTYVAPFIEELATGIQDLWNTHLKPFVDSVAGLIGSIIDALGVLWNKWLKPIVDWIVQNILPIIIPIVTQVWNIVSSAGGIIIDVITLVINVIKGIIDFLVGVFTGDWDKAWAAIGGIFDNIWNSIMNVITTVINFVSGTIKNGLSIIWNTAKTLLGNLFNTFKSIFNNIKSTISTIIDGIKTVFKNGWNGIWDVVKGVINKIIGGVEKMANAVIKGVNKIFKPLADVGNTVLEAVGIKGFKFSELKTISIPRLEKGGIINLPGRGVPVGGAIGGERGQEGVLPLTDSQQMELLGEAIGRYITVNTTMNNYMNSRLISRELNKSNNESDFAFNR